KLKLLPCHHGTLLDVIVRFDARSRPDVGKLLQHLGVRFEVMVLLAVLRIGDLFARRAAAPQQSGPFTVAMTAVNIFDPAVHQAVEALRIAVFLNPIAHIWQASELLGRELLHLLGTRLLRMLLFARSVRSRRRRTDDLATGTHLAPKSSADDLLFGAKHLYLHAGAGLAHPFWRAEN